MRDAMVIAAREVREKSRLFLVSLGFAILPFAATLLPGSRGHESEVIAVVGGYLAAFLGLGIAATLGGSTVVRDLVERRMSFYFTRPVGAPAIWIGKALASIFISIASVLIIAGPAMLVARQRWDAQWLGELDPLLLISVAIVVVFVVTHTLSTITRSRSPLIGLDFLFAILSVGAIYLIVRPLILAMAVNTAVNVLVGIVAAVGMALTVAPVWQLANGRSDIRRSHAALMRFLWPAIAIVLLLAGGVVAWITHVEPSDVAVTDIFQPQRGTLVRVTGRAPGRGDYAPTFLIDRRAGKAASLTRQAAMWGTQFSADGRTAAWMQPDGAFRPTSFSLYSTNGPSGIPISNAYSFVLSDDGARVAMLNGRMLTVYDLASGRMLGSAAGFQGGGQQYLFFAAPDVVRVIEHARAPGAPLRVFELDLRSRALRKTGEQMLPGRVTSLSVSRSSGSIFLGGANLILDGRTGQTVGSVTGADLLRGVVLHDGSVAVTTRAGGGRGLRIHDRTGAVSTSIALPGVGRAFIVGETTNGKLLVLAREGVFPDGQAPPPSSGQAMWVIDTATGAVERKVQGVRGPMPQWSPDPRLPRYAADQEFAALDRQGKLVSWSLARPEVRPLLE